MDQESAGNVGKESVVGTQNGGPAMVVESVENVFRLNF